MTSERIRRIIVDGDLAEGRGLDPDCRLGEVERAIGPIAERGTGRLSEFPHAWAKLRFGDRSEARAWTAIDDDRVILIDVDYPPVTETPAALRERFGEPAATRRARHDVIDQEWAYPERGLTVAVDRHLEHVTYLYVYAPTTLSEYLTHLGGKDEWVIRHPLR